MDKNRPTDSEYIEMASHGLDISMDNDYDVIPADYGVQAQSTSRKIAGINYYSGMKSYKVRHIFNI